MFDLGADTLQLLLLDNGNSRSGNAFDPGFGIDGTGRVILGTIDVQGGRIYDPEAGSFIGAPALAGLAFGTMHVGDAAHLRYALTNVSGNAGWLALGALQTPVDGGNVTDPALSGSGVTPQNFSIAPRGGTAPFEITLDTAEARRLEDQAVHLGFEFNGVVFGAGATLPIAGAVLNHADPRFELASGTGALVQEGSHWTLDLGTLAQGSNPVTVLLAIHNAATAPADDLGGSFDVAGDAAAVSGAESFAGLAAGDSLAMLRLRLDTATPGPHAETITLYPVGSNASGDQGALPAVTLTVTDLVAAEEGKPEHGGHDAPWHHRAHGQGHADAHHHRGWPGFRTA